MLRLLLNEKNVDSIRRKGLKDYQTLYWKKHFQRQQKSNQTFSDKIFLQLNSFVKLFLCDQSNPIYHGVLYSNTTQLNKTCRSLTQLWPSLFFIFIWLAISFKTPTSSTFVFKSTIWCFSMKNAKLFKISNFILTFFEHLICQGK